MPTQDRWLGGVLAVLCVGFLAQAWRYHFVCDDAYVAFRYARNLVDGDGLVYNVGERVEAFTSPLWVGVLALGMIAGVPPEAASVGLGMLCGCLTLVVLHIGARRAFPQDRVVCWAAPLLLASTRIFAAWASGGLETALFTLLLTASVLRFGVELTGTRRRLSWLLFLVLYLARPEGALLGAVCLGSALLWDRSRWKDWIAAALKLGAGVGLHVALRLYYYGVPLPNTFYAKVTGFHWAIGLRYLAQWALDYGAIVYLPLLAAILVADRRMPRPWSGVACRAWLLVTATYLTYVAAIGGDFYEYRFVVPILPLFYLMVVRGTASIEGAIPRARHARLGLLALIWALTSVPAIVGFTPAQGPAPIPDGSIEVDRAFTAALHETARWLASVAEPGDQLGVDAAGVIPYVTGLRAIDTFGLTQAGVREWPIADPGAIGHERVVPASLLRSRRVEFVLSNYGVPTASVTSDPGMIYARIAPGRYVAFRTFSDRAALLERLRARGADIVLPGGTGRHPEGAAGLKPEASF